MDDRDEDQRIGAYAPPTDDYDMFDARGEDSRRGPLLLTAAVAVLVLFAGVVWKAYQLGVRDQDAAPRITADGEPYRVRPADPGGEETPNTDIVAYDAMTGDADPSGEDATPRDAPEEPIEEARPALQVETVDEGEAAGLRRDEPDESAPDVTPRARPEPEARPEPVQPEPEQPEPETAPTPEPATAGPSASASVDLDGDWVVQIASLRSAEDAEAAWLSFRSAYGDLARGAAPDILPVEIEGRGTYHRLRIAAFADRASANEFCATLQSRGQDCLVRRR